MRRKRGRIRRRFRGRGGVDGLEETGDLTKFLLDPMDYHFPGLPASIPHGQHLWEVTNTGHQLVELVIGRIAPGVTYEQVRASLLAPPATPEAAMPGMDASTFATDEPMAFASEPFHEIGGLAPANPGAQGWVVIDLDAGDYFAICFIPDRPVARRTLRSACFNL